MSVNNSLDEHIAVETDNGMAPATEEHRIPALVHTGWALTSTCRRETDSRGGGWVETGRIS